MGGFRRRRGEWESLVAELEASGAGLRQFAQARGLHPGTLGWWRAQFRRVPPRGVGFAEVEVLRSVSRTMRIEADLPSGARRSFEVPFVSDARTPCSVVGIV